MIGAYPGENFHLDSYAGTASNTRGLSYYTSNGYVYHANTKCEYLPSSTTGSYVAVEVNMKTKKIRWRVNGKLGAKKDIPLDSCYIGVTLCTQNDSVEILPHLCWSM